MTSFDIRGTAFVGHPSRPLSVPACRSRRRVSRPGEARPPFGRASRRTQAEIVRERSGKVGVTRPVTCGPSAGHGRAQGKTITGSQLI
jgi:hypothetical protein